MKGNIGEWSEIYTLLWLLLHGEAALADSNLQPVGGRIRFLRLIKQEQSGQKHFYPGQHQYGEVDSAVSPQQIEAALANFERVVSAGRNLGAFEMPELHEIMQRLGLAQLRASSRTKTDLLVEIEDLFGGPARMVGFSIKSELGSPSTLINAGGHTAFKFQITGDADLAKRIGEEVPSSKVSLLLRRLSDNNIGLKPYGPKSPVLRENLEFFGVDVPDLMSSLLVGYYLGQGKTVWSLLHNLGFEGPHHDQARYKVGQFLRAAAMGMKPASTWRGFNEMHGGFLILRKTGQVLALPASNEETFREYLLKHTYFDTPSTPRHKFGSLYFEEGVPCLDLSLQIRLGAKAIEG